MLLSFFLPPPGGASAHCRAPYSLWEAGETGKTLCCTHQAFQPFAGQPGLPWQWQWKQWCPTVTHGNQAARSPLHLLLRDCAHQTEADLQDAAQTHHHQRPQEALVGLQRLLTGSEVTWSIWPSEVIALWYHAVWLHMCTSDPSCKPLNQNGFQRETLMMPLSSMNKYCIIYVVLYSLHLYIYKTEY